MLPKEKRLTKQKDFDKVYKESKSLFGVILSLRCSKNNLNKTRVAIVVSNKISKKAVERNKIKRRVRAAVSQHIEKIDIGYDCVFIAKIEIIDKTYQEIEKAVTMLLKKRRVLS